MSELIRFGISIPKDLLESFDDYLHRQGYDNRSEAIRDLIRDQLVREEWAEAKETAGAIVFIYDHHVRELSGKITAIQHDYHHVIISTQHVHLDHDRCLEIIAVKGDSGLIRELHGRLKAVKGIKHTALNMTSTGKHLH